MPTEREECPFCDYEEGSCLAWLNVKDDDEIRYCIQGGHPPKDRPEWCPLVELPDHGDLIDKDFLMEMCDAPHWCVWLNEIEDAPAVIPAERSEE